MHNYHTYNFFALSRSHRVLGSLCETPLKHQYLPHMAVSVWDSTRETSETLCSELVAGLHVNNYVFSHGKFTDHHTIPVLVYSFHHSAFARITQVHWDGAALTIRHSRLLDLRGPKPTPDAYLLLRWMLSTPCGQNAYEMPENAVGNTVFDHPAAQSSVVCPAVGVRA